MHASQDSTNWATASPPQYFYSFVVIERGSSLLRTKCKAWQYPVILNLPSDSVLSFWFFSREGEKFSIWCHMTVTLAMLYAQGGLITEKDTRALENLCPVHPPKQSAVGLREVPSDSVLFLLTYSFQHSQSLHLPRSSWQATLGVLPCCTCKALIPRFSLICPTVP